jgi:hypothetical protein
MIDFICEKKRLAPYDQYIVRGKPSLGFLASPLV